MRRLFTLLLLSGIVSTGFSQINYKIVSNPQNGANPDTIIQPYKDEIRKNKVPDYGIPNAITVKSLPLVYRGNNGQGFDIYDSPIDNMPVLKPDSGFGSHMPVAKFATPEKIMTVPSVNTPGLKEYFEKKKQKDTIAVKPWQPKIYPIPKK